ncbi:MAG: hypothetical protein WBP97_18075, partial [Candidatus Sulfotelmatobacter sp.]
MAVSRFFASALLALACGCVIAQDTGQAPDASSLPSSSSSSPSGTHQSSSADHRSGHYIRVPDEDAAVPPPEL